MAKNPFGHSQECTCENCQNWKDAQLGMELLAMLKSRKQKKRCWSCDRKVRQVNFCPYCGEKQE